MARNPGEITITVVRPSSQNDHGTQVDDWSDTTTHTVAGCDVQSGTSQEVITNRDAVLYAWFLFAPYEADILPTDHIRYLGKDYQIDGAPAPKKSTTGRLDYLWMPLQLWEG